MAALDRYFKQADIEAKLTGEYQKKQENKIDAPNREEVIVEAYKFIFEQKTEEEALASIRAIYQAPEKPRAGMLFVLQSKRIAAK
jgi:hypothetical protein